MIKECSINGARMFMSNKKISTLAFVVAGTTVFYIFEKSTVFLGKQNQNSWSLYLLSPV